MPRQWGVVVTDRFDAMLLARAIAASLVLVSGLYSTVMTQDRMPPIPADKMTEAQVKAAQEFKAARGTDVFGPFVPLLRSPDLMNRVRALGDYLRFKSVLGPKLSEFMIIMTARQFNQSYEWSVHQPLALKAGLGQDIVKAIAEGRRPDRMAEDEAVLYDVWDELRRNLTVSDATYARAVAKLGEHGLMDAVNLVGFYTMQALTLNTARTPVPSGTPVLSPLGP
jgi:4-carboxymuconolactone decarboxylase